MKKRRELDALIGNRSKRETTVDDNGQLEYNSLNSSLSSPTADTYMPPNGHYFVSSKRINRTSGRGCNCTFRRMIRICLPACFLSLVAACITACIGIVWMQVQLKTDVERLRDRLAKLETWQNDQPSALNDMKKTMSVLEKDVHDVKEGENGVRGLAEKLALLTQKFEEQVVVPSQRLQDIKSQSEGIEKTIEELKASMMSLKSTVEEMHTSNSLLTAAHDQLKATVDNIEADLSDTNVKQLTNLVSSSKQNAEDGITMMNLTLQLITNNLTSLQREVGDIEQRISPEELWKELGPQIEPLKEDIVSLKEKAANGQALTNVSKEISDLKSQVTRLLSGAKTGTSIHSTSPETALKAITTQPNDGIRNFHLLPLEAKTGALADILAGLQEKFDAFDGNNDGRLSQGELVATYGEEISSGLLKYDRDHDGMLSKNEVFGVPTTAKTPQSAMGKQRRSSKR